MAYFDGPRKFDELPQQTFQVFAVQCSVLERDRELNQQSAEFSGCRKSFQTFSRQSFIFIIGTDRSSGSRLYSGQWRVGKRPMQLGGEKKTGISVGCNAGPEFC